MTDTATMLSTEPADDTLAAPGVSPRRAAWQRFVRYRLALPGAITLALLVLGALLGPLVWTVDPNVVDPAQYRKPPGPGHPLGTDSAGRDVLARLLVGARVSLAVGLAAALTATIVGILLGSLAGYLRGWVDALLNRISEVFQSFPTIIVIITVAAVMGPSLPGMIIIIGLMDWTGAFRVTRGLTMSLREQDSIQAVVGLGAPSSRVVLRHVVPAVLGPATVVATGMTGGVIMLEAALSFLGLGVPPPTASWGSMLNQAQSLSILEGMPWLWLPPGLAIAVTVLSVNFIGEGLRNAVDPKQGRR
ncbi:ABC transporter permease [Propionibacteriaceae bacterium Y2011]